MVHGRIAERARTWPGIRFQAEEIIRKLRAIEVHMAKGLKPEEASGSSAVICSTSGNPSATPWIA